MDWPEEKTSGSGGGGGGGDKCPNGTGKKVSGIEFRSCRHRVRLRRAEARGDNGNRDGPTDRKRQPRGASLACHLSSQLPRGDTPVPLGTFRIKAHRAVKNYIFLPLNAFYQTASTNLFLVRIGLASGLWIIQSQRSLLL